MTKRIIHRTALAAAIAVLAGCTALPSVTAPPATRALTGPTGTMTFQIAIPHGKRGDRKLNYVSGATSWVRIVADGSAVVSEAVTQDLNPSASGSVVYTGDNAGADLYTITAKLPVSEGGVAYPLTVETYNATNSGEVDAAHMLCTGTQSVTVTEGTVNDLGTLTLKGIPVYVLINNSNFNLDAGIPAVGNLSCAALDAGGNPIVGDYAVPVVVAENHPNLTIADPNITSDTDLNAVVIYDGGANEGTKTDLTATVGGNPIVFAGTPTIFFGEAVSSILIDKVTAGADNLAYASGSGGTLDFDAQITTNTDISLHDPVSQLHEVTWSITGATDAATIDPTTGVLTFSGDATKYGLVNVVAENVTSGTTSIYPLPVWRVEIANGTNSANVAAIDGTVHLHGASTLAGLDAVTTPNNWSLSNATTAPAGDFGISWTTDGSGGTPTLRFTSSDGFTLDADVPL